MSSCRSRILQLLCQRRGIHIPPTFTSPSWHAASTWPQAHRMAHQCASRAWQMVISKSLIVGVIRVIIARFSIRYAEMITRISLDLAGDSRDGRIGERGVKPSALRPHQRCHQADGWVRRLQSVAVRHHQQSAWTSPHADDRQQGQPIHSYGTLPPDPQIVRPVTTGPE
jgi:hypothetical protein